MDSEQPGIKSSRSASPSKSPPKAEALAPWLLQQVRERLRVKNYAIRTEQAYVYWIKYSTRKLRLPSTHATNTHTRERKRLAQSVPLAWRAVKEMTFLNAEMYPTP